jgi:enoyl-CoA hydratase/carnithine racemase
MTARGMFAEIQERITMPGLRDYEDRYSSIRFERREGVLQMTLHHDGGEFIVSESALRDLGRAFRDVGQDTENRVVILTGTGERFVTQFDDGSFAATMRPDIFEFWRRTRTDGVRLLQAFLDIEVPVISAINGPVVSHSETPLLADVVLATENTVFQDATHFLNGIPPADGMHTIWTTLLGLNRGRHFLLTGRVLTAQQALDYGVVGEVLPQEELLPRAWELATTWASFSPATLRGTRAAGHPRVAPAAARAVTHRTDARGFRRRLHRSTRRAGYPDRRARSTALNGSSSTVRHSSPSLSSSEAFP